MTTTKKRFREWFKEKSELFNLKITETFESPKKTFKFLAIFIFSILFFIEMGIILINNSFYNNFSDDILQYYTIIVDFVAQIKAGTLSSFNLNNYLGASYFSDVYYVPLDIFTAITFVLSYVMPTELAYSVTELVKIWAGVMIFAYYLHMNKMKPRTIFWMAVIYFISGGSVSFMAFPAFLSLAFYLPLGLVVIQWFIRGKKWVVPLYVFALIFYDFYLGYTAIAFVSILYIIETIKQPGFKFFKFIFDGIQFLGLILLGVLMSTVILYPSILFILEQTYRPENTFNGWVVNVLGKEIKLFQPTIYIRIFAKMFVEQKPIGFYGFENHYGLEHFSLFISVVGFVYMNYIFFMKDKIAWIYKVVIFLGIIMMFFPIFSYVLSGTTDVPYTRWINMLPLVQIMILAHVFDRYGFEEIKMKWLTIPIVIMLGTLAYTMYYYIIHLMTDVKYVSRDVMTADTVLMGVAGLILICIIIFGWLKKYQWIKRIFWVEFIIALVYIYSGPFSIRNKIDTFQEMDEISDFLEDSLDHDEFFRVYVDFEHFDAEDINFNRMTQFPTNTEIFHSWTDKETNDISMLLFNVYEYQSKDRLDLLSVYLNHFLGYKYILISAEANLELPEDYFTLFNENEKFRLYEILNAEPFQVYESYLTYSQFKSTSEYSKQKLLLMTAVIDADRYATNDLNLEEQSPINPSYYSTAKSYTSVTNSTGTAVMATGITNTLSRAFIQYSAEQFKVDFSSGAAYIRSTYGTMSLGESDYGEVYMTFDDGTSQSCQIMTDTNLTHRVKCEFGKQPNAFFFEVTENYKSIGKTDVRLERALNGAAYLVYDFNNIQPNGMMAFKIGSMDIERAFLVDINGTETECFNRLCFIESQPVRIYVYKTGDMYNSDNLFALDFQYLYDDLSDYSENIESNISNNHSLIIENGKIELSYTRTSDTSYDQIVMIPVSYSEEWIITSDISYETMSVSGGFLGIVIPHGTTNIEVSLKFVPEGLKDGAKASVAGFGIYAVIFLPVLLESRKRKLFSRLKETEVNDHEKIDNHSTSL